MHRIDTEGAIDDLFQEGDPGIGQRATRVSADWLNDVQQNICAVIEAAGIALDKGEASQLLLALKGLAAPAGKVDFFALTSAPAGWLKANGAAVSRAAYAGLFAAIGTTYGVGDGATTFNLPDFRAEFLRGLDDGRGVDTGRTLGSAQSSQNLSHRHPSPTAATGTPGNYEVPDASSSFDAYDFQGALSAIAYTDYDGGTEARPRNAALLVCIKY